MKQIRSVREAMDFLDEATEKKFKKKYMLLWIIIKTKR